MNSSPSNASLASSKKPSTANSNASNKRSRTIIVARNISDAPLSSSAPAGAERPAVSANLGSSASRLPGAISSGFTIKLPTYAALGSSEDVGLYQKYLSEQTKGGHRSASELRNGGNMGGHHSPQHLMASMKRKTVSQLSIDESITSAVDTSSGSNNHHQSTDSLPPRPGDTADTNAETNSATRAVMQLEMEQDAKKRRDALVQHRKWLQALPIHERLVHQRQQNALKHWQQINRDWEHFKTRACKKLGKTEKELVVTRTAKYREQVEMYDALQKAKPLSEKVGGDFWLMSLRDDGTRFVPVGNIFSGLFCPIRESTKLGPRIRRPLDHISDKNRQPATYEDVEDQESGDSNNSKPVSLLEKRSLELLARKKRRLRKQLQALLPHEVDDSASSKLVVGTTDLFEWASRGDINNNYSRAGTPESSMLSLPLDNSAVERAASRSQQSSSARDESNLQLQSGPSLQIAVLNLENGDDFHEKPQRSSSYTAEPEPLLLSFYGDTSQLLQRSILLSNDGSTVLHYQWTHEYFFHPSITPHLIQKGGPNSSSRELSSQSLKKRTFVSQTQGSILPGEQETFVFSFEALKPGLFLEKWLLDVDPPARISFDSVVANNSNIANLGGDNGLQQSPRSPTTKVSAYKPVEVHLKCTAVDNFTPTTQYSAQMHAIEKQKTVFMVEQLVEIVLKQVDSKPKAEFPEFRKISELDQFYSLNKGAFGDVYYSEALVGKCRELYTQARQVLVFHASFSENGIGGESGDASSAESSSQSAASSQSASGGLPTPDAVRVTARGSSRGLEPEGAGEQAEEDVPFPPSATVEEESWDLSLSNLRTITRKADALNAAKRKDLAKELQKLIEVEEEDEEEDEDEEEEDDDEEDDEDEKEDDGDDDDDNEDASPSQVAKSSAKKLTAQEKKAVRAAHRARILQEILQKRQELEAHIDLLRPQLQDTFQATYLEAYVAPYDSSALGDQLAQKIAHLCSEVPVIHGIRRMLQQQQKQHIEDVRVETERGVAQVLTRAIDEAIAFDMEYQLQYEYERKRLQHVLLSDKLTYQQALGQSGSNGKEPISNDTWLSRGVLLLHIDLDLANWFTLVKDTTASPSPSASVETGGTLDPSTPAQASETQVLKWQFSPELLNRDDFVPEKVTKAAQSIRILVQLIREVSKSIPVKAIVLVSDLSSPPMTKPMKKLMATVKEKEQDERTLLDGIAHQLTLQPVAQVLERAMGNCATSNNDDSSIEFCASIDQLTEKLRLLPTLGDEKALASSSSIGEPAEEGERESEVFSNVEITRPKLFLAEHLKALAGGGGKKPNSSDSAFQEKPATPASPVPQPPVAAAAVASPDPKSAAARKKSVAVTAPQTKVAPAAAGVALLAAIPVTAPFVEQALTTCVEGKQKSAIGEASLGSDTITVERLQAKALGAQLAELCDAFVIDTFLPPPCESVFIPSSSVSSFGDEQQPEKANYKQPVLVLGPNLLKKTKQWAQILQSPLSTEEKKPRAATTAIIGGKNLAGKLRLIDNLLEVADRIYFVGDVALSLYRVLFTKHDDKRKRWRKVSPQSPLSLWSILVPGVERLKQKARRKCVELLLPMDWIVGETALEEQDTVLSVDGDEDEDDDEEDDLEEEDDMNSKKPRKKQLKAKKPKKPIFEPDEVDSWRSKPRQWQYDGEKTHVGIDANGLLFSDGNSKSASALGSWISAFDVDLEIFSKFKVLKGKPSVLNSKSMTTSEDEDEEDAGNDESNPNHGDATASKNDGSSGVHESDTQEMAVNASELDNPTNFEFEWTLRAFDVGPESMKTLLSHLQQSSQASRSHQLIVHGLFGVVECRDFDRATREFVSFLEAEWAPSFYSQAQVDASASPDTSLQNQHLEQREPKLLLSGESTLEWIQQLRRAKPKQTQEPLQHSPVLVTNQERKMAHILRDVLAAKPNAMLSSLNAPPPSAEEVQVEEMAELNDAKGK